MIYLFAALGGLLAAGLIFLFLHNTSFETERLTIESENVMRDFTVVQLSDLHGRRYKKSIEKAVRALSPELIVLTGDMFAEPGEKDEEKTINNVFRGELLTKLRAGAKLYPDVSTRAR